MIGFKPHYCTHGAGFRRTESLWVRRIRRLRFRFRGSLSKYFDSCHRDKEWIDNSSPIRPQIGLEMRTWLEVGHFPDTVC